MLMLLRSANLANKKLATTLLLVALVGLQMLYSFRFPSVGDNTNWLPISDYLPKFSVEGSDNFLIRTFLPIISSEYRLNSDVGEYLIVAKDFSADYLNSHQYLNRPLYPFLIFFISKLLSPIVSPSYGILFGVAILFNFVLIAAAAVLFFKLLLKIFRSEDEARRFKIAFLSSTLLVFSPFVHSFIIQPMPEMLTAFGVIFSLYLLFSYLDRPTLVKLALFSFIGGIMMLGKMFFAMPLFILMLAVYYRRFREGMVFAMYFALPVFLWYLWVTKVWGIPYYVHEVQHWNMGIWIFSIFEMPFQQALRITVSAIPNFISAILHSFIFIPVLFAVLALWSLNDKIKSILCYSLILSIFIMVFLIHLYLYRHTFMLFPVIYPLAILGIEGAARYAEKQLKLSSSIFQAAAISGIIIISSINIYNFYYYLN